MKKKILLLVLTLILSFVLASCGSKDLLLGTWKEPMTGITMKFEDDGSLTISKNGVSFSMTYEKQEPSLLAISASTDGAFAAQTLSYSVTKDTLTLTVDNTDTVLDRVK
jgi:uncharacterized lipoprotein YehR (DUF1307 family)